MKSKLLTIVALSAALALLPGRGARAAETLAHTLPERAILYAEVDVGATAEDLMEYLRFIDSQHAEGLRRNTLELVACLKELAARYEFTPLAIDSIGKLSRTHVLGRCVDEIPHQALCITQGANFFLDIRVELQCRLRGLVFLVPLEAVRGQTPSEAGLQSPITIPVTIQAVDGFGQF